MAFFIGGFLPKGAKGLRRIATLYNTLFSKLRCRKLPDKQTIGAYSYTVERDESKCK